MLLSPGCSLQSGALCFSQQSCMMLPCSRLLLTALLLLGITSWAPAQPNWSSPGPALTEDRALTAGGPVGARTENITGLGGTGAPIQPEPGGTGTNNPSQSGATWTNAPSQPEDTGTNALSEPEGNGTNTPSPLGETGSDGALAPEGNGTNTPSPLGETGANAPSEPEGNGTNTPLGLASSRTESRLVGTGTTLPSEMGGTESKTSLAQERTGTSIRGEPVTTEIHNQSDSGGSGTHNPHKIGAVKTHISSDPEEAGISISPEPETLGTYFATEPRRTWTPNKTTQDRNVSDPPWMDPHTPSELTGTMNWTKVGQSQLGSRTELYMTTGSDVDITQKDGQTSSATEPIQKSATKRHANEGTSDTMYFSTTFHRGSDRTLLSVTNSSVTSDITDLLTAYNTAVDSSSAKTSLARGREITKNSGITAQDFNVTTRDSDVTTRDSGITVRGLGFSTQYSGITTQDSTVPTQESGTTQQNTNTTSYSSVSVPGSDPLMTPYRIPTASSPSVHHYSDSTVPVTTVPVTTANTTDLFTGQEVPTNNSFLDPSLSSSSSSPTNSSFSFNSSLFITDSSSSTVSFTSSQFTRETVSSSTYKETTMSSLPITESSSSGAFSSSPIPSTLVLSTQSSASPTPHSEIPPQSSSTSSYFSLSPTSRLPLVPSVSPSTSQLPKTYTTSPTAGSTETNVILTTPESLNQTVQSSTAPITSYHTGITQTTQRNGHSTITEATRTDGTGSSGAMNNTSFPMTGDLSVYTRKPIEGTALATTSSAERSTLSRVDGPVQPAVSEPPATSKGVFIKPQDSSQPPLIGSSESSLTTNVPKKLLPKETTTKLDQSTSSSLLDLRTSTAAHTKSRKEAQTTISVRTGVYPTTFATTPSTIVASTIVTNTASSAFSLCLLNPCQNGGLCVIDIINKSYRCVCPPAWQGQHCGNDVDECLSNPCPAQASCSNTKGSFICRCPLGYILEKGTGCVLARTFLGHIKVPRSFLNSSKYTDLHQIEEEIVRIMNMSFSSISGYYQSTVTDTRDTNHIIVSVQNVFSLASNVTTFDIISNLQNYMRLCESFPEISSGCQLILHPQLYYMAVSLCNLKNPGCDKDTADCTDLTGIAMCQCKPGYFKFSKTDQSCRACEDGFKRENGTCVRCPFGLGGFNCSNPYQLITVIIAAAGGGLLLVLGIALTITCCRKNKNDISKLIYKSGDFQMSPYAEYPKTQRSSEWGRETIEMQENGSTKNLLQMTDVYYSPGLRNSELERNGLYPYTGLPGSRHSCIYPGQYNPSFIGEENRRRDYF